MRQSKEELQTRLIYLDIKECMEADWSTERHMLDTLVKLSNDFVNMVDKWDGHLKYTEAVEKENYTRPQIPTE